MPPRLPKSKTSVNLVLALVGGLMFGVASALVLTAVAPYLVRELPGVLRCMTVPDSFSGRLIACSPLFLAAAIGYGVLLFGYLLMVQRNRDFARGSTAAPVARQAPPSQEWPPAANASAGPTLSRVEPVGRVGEPQQAPTPTGEYAAQVKSLAARLDAVPTDYESRWELARLHYRNRQHVLAASEYRQLLSQRPELHDARAELADVYIALGMIPKAEVEITYLAQIGRFQEWCSRKMREISSIG